MTTQFSNPTIIHVTAPYIFAADNIFITEEWGEFGRQMASGVFHFDDYYNAVNLYGRLMTDINPKNIEMRPLASHDRGFYDTAGLPIGEYMFCASVLEYLDATYGRPVRINLLNGLRFRNGFFDTLELKHNIIAEFGLSHWHEMEVSLTTIMITK